MTVAQVIAELSKLPGHLPVAGVLYRVDVDEDGETQAQTVEGRCEVSDVRFEGRFVALDCDGAWL